MNEIDCIYALVDPRDNRMRYIGKTCRDLDLRLGEHIYRPTNKLTEEWLNELRRYGVKPLIKTLEYVNPEVGAKIEQRYIRRMFNKGIGLLNITRVARYKPPKTPTVPRKRVVLMLIPEVYDAVVLASSKSKITPVLWIEQQINKSAQFSEEPTS